jgi:hypothetical protein
MKICQSHQRGRLTARSLLVVLLLASAAGSTAQAATITVEPASNGKPALVAIDGDLEINDGEQFRSKTHALSKAVVSFRSDGGSVVAGIQIGESIREKRFTTVVPGNARCASACAIAWLGGTPRLMSADARVGFHAAYSKATGQETAVGNALIGAYLDKIGLPESAVIYITQAAPNSMTWLSFTDAGKYGIDVKPAGAGEITDAPAVQPKAAASAPAPISGTPSDEKKATNGTCSDQASAKGLQGIERLGFSEECKRRGGQ